MSYNYKYIMLSIALVAALKSTSLHGQVTIGSPDTPKIGALLDLKENSSQGVNSTKGLLLPRVHLTDMTDMTVDISDVTASSIPSHLGLMIYNTNEDFCGKQPIAKGVHIWNGTLWQYIGPEIKHPEVKVFVDPRDGERYLYRNFGGEVGVWMLENMRAKRLPGATTDIELHSGLNNERTPRYGYPSDTNGDSWKVPTPEKARAGLIYNWYAFTNNYAPGAINQGELPNGADNPNSVENIGPNGTVAGKKYVQGICPDGWHIPSDKEWNLLEKEIYNNAEKYSAYPTKSFSPEVWDDAWNAKNDLRGSDQNSKVGHSYAMLNICSAGGVDNSFGKSYPAEYGGFNAYISGYFFVATPTDTDPYQPGMCVFGSASNSESERNFWVRMIFNPFMVNNPSLMMDTKVDRYSLNAEAMVAIRCKQNVK